MPRLEPTGEHEPKRQFGRPVKYPWDDWTDGNPWYIARGEDYTSETEAQRVNLYQRARVYSLGLVIEIDRVQDGILFQFYPKAEEAPKLPSLANVRPVSSDVPLCSVCSKPLPGMSVAFGECGRYDVDLGRFVSDHEKES